MRRVIPALSMLARKNMSKIPNTEPMERRRSCLFSWTGFIKIFALNLDHNPCQAGVCIGTMNLCPES